MSMTLLSKYKVTEWIIINLLININLSNEKQQIE